MFGRLKKGNFDVVDKEPERTTKKLEDADEELQVLLDEDPAQTEEQVLTRLIESKKRCVMGGASPICDINISEMAWHRTYKGYRDSEVCSSSKKEAQLFGN